jgi:hypothetical protein
MGPLWSYCYYSLGNCRMIIVQLLMLVIAILSALEELHATAGFRECGAVAGDLRKFHLYGWLLIGAICAGFGLLSSPELLVVVKVTALCSLIYWLVFDISYALLIKKPWYYLGETSWWDRLVGRNGGKLKAGFCLIAIGILNFI